MNLRHDLLGSCFSKVFCYLKLYRQRPLYLYILKTLFFKAPRQSTRIQLDHRVCSPALNKMCQWTNEKCGGGCGKILGTSVARCRRRPATGTKRAHAGKSNNTTDIRGSTLCNTCLFFASDSSSFGSDSSSGGPNTPQSNN
jgi:hypothetical protein